MPSRSITSRALPLGAALAVATSFAPDARATGLLVAHFGGEWGHPMSNDLWSIYYNPAGLSLLEGTRLTLSGDFAWRSLKYTRQRFGRIKLPEHGPSCPSGRSQRTYFGP